MADRLHVAPRACSTCPYRRDAEPGIWDASEYRKLGVYDQEPCRMKDPSPALVTFRCHQEAITKVPTVCRGWLGVHRASVAVRVAVCFGRLGWEDVPREAEPYLYASGTQACEAGLAGVATVTPKAQIEIQKLERKLRRRRW